jgi:transcription-repair coupling factor (superfamily II helicase)
VKRIVPRARIAVAHGQMRERDLEDIMHAFVNGEVDVLVSTMIVESGLDVSNANTMFVNRADMFGLAQLYQLRGRVGRSHRRAYCYLMVPDHLDEDAERRLRVLEHHTELGAGYRIALKDMEMRGAGNLLGPEQSGFVHSVGFDLYLRLLVLRCQAGDRAALQELIHDHHPRLRAFLHKMLPDQNHIDDLAQEVWIDVFRELPRLSEPGAFRPWLFRIARNRAYRALRRRTPDPAPLDETQVPGGPDPMTNGFGSFRPSTMVSSVGMVAGSVVF